MKFSIYQNSRKGPRKYNQDRLAYSYSKDALLMVLADGMGGYKNGDVAAELATKTLTDSFQRLAKPTLPSPAKFLIDHIEQVHHTIENVRRSKNMDESPRTTIVAAVIQGNTLYCAHVGDSRLYHFRDGHLLFRTEDHSVVQSLYKKGLIAKDEMKTHPYRNKVYTCLGGDEDPQIELADRQELKEGDTLLLCSDGIWGVLDDKAIKQTILTGKINDALSKLLDESEYHSDEKAGDNMSAIALQWGDKTDNSLGGVSTYGMNLDQTTTILNPSANLGADETFTEDDIESTIAEIQEALNKSKL